MKPVFVISVLAIAVCLSCNIAKKQKELSPDEIRDITKRAYIFTYPLVLNYRTMYNQAIDSSAAEYLGGFGTFKHYGLFTADNKDVVSPNNDTPYSWAWADLRSEPWVLIMPPIDGDRYYASQWDDLWAFVLDSPGSIEDGEQGGAYLIAPPDWKGELPEGVKRVIKGESFFLGCITRTGVGGPEDMPNVKAIQNQYQLIPLSAYLHQRAPAPAERVNWLPFNDADIKTINAFKYVNFILPFTVPHEMDKPALEEMARLGITPGAAWDTAQLDEATRTAMRQGIADAFEEMAALQKKVKSGAELFNTRERMGADYDKRMLGVQEGIFGNFATQAVYMTWHNDADGHPLNTGQNSYKVTFTKEQIPKAKYFWSITMYNLPERLLVSNPINRYSIGSRSKDLKTNPDGSIDIYISQNSPGKTLESNWLPAPAGVPAPVMRIYGPDEKETAGKAEVPPMVKI